MRITTHYGFGLAVYSKVYEHVVGGVVEYGTFLRLNRYLLSRIAHIHDDRMYFFGGKQEEEKDCASQREGGREDSSQRATSKMRTRLVLDTNILIWDPRYTLYLCAST
jgi:hypothetical protein